jgi:hypothetical protein
MWDKAEVAKSEDVGYKWVAYASALHCEDGGRGHGVSHLGGVERRIERVGLITWSVECQSAALSEQGRSDKGRVRNVERGGQERREK